MQEQSRRTPRERGDFTTAIAQALRESVAAQNLSRAEVSRVSGIPSATLYPLLRGEKPIDMEQLRRLALALGTTRSAIVRRAEEICPD